MKLPVIIPYFNFDGKETHKAFLLKLLLESKKYGVEFIVAEGVHSKLSQPLPDLSSRCAEHLVFPAPSCLWLKENLINLAVRNSSLTSAAFAFIDADLIFCDDDWAIKSLDALSRVDMLQPFSHRHDTNSEYVIAKSVDHPRVEPHSFAYRLNGKSNTDLVQGHPGFAWVMRRSAFDKINGLFDKMIVGGGDSCLATLVASNLTDDFKFLFSRRFHPRYHCMFLAAVLAKAKAFKKLKCGFLNGSVVHLYHGDLSKRKYNQRFELLLSCKFDLESDLTYSDKGVLQYSSADTALENAVSGYLASRST